MKKLLALVLVIAFVMTGCNGKTDSTGQSSEQTTTTTAATTPSTTTTTTETVTTTASTTATTETKAENPLLALGFEQKEGYVEFLEIENSPISGGGLRIQYFQDENKLHMIKTDANGNDTVEYLTFFIDKKEVEKYRYVSMMGAGFYYYYNIEKDELYKIENDSHTDKTESTKQAGRFENAYDEVKKEAAKITEYFANKFMPMEELKK